MINGFYYSLCETRGYEKINMRAWAPTYDIPTSSPKHILIIPNAKNVFVKHTRLRLAHSSNSCNPRAYSSEVGVALRRALTIRSSSFVISANVILIS
jgi:hypothetical protein